MMITPTPVEQLHALARPETGLLAATENLRVLELLRSLDDDDWLKQTDCTAWDVRAMAARAWWR